MSVAARQPGSKCAMQQDQLTITDEQYMTGDSRWLLERMIDPVLRLNFLADKTDHQWDRHGMWAPRPAADLDDEQREEFGRARGELDVLVELYDRMFGHDRFWIRDFEALTSWRVQGRGRFMVKPVRWGYPSVGSQYIPFFSAEAHAQWVQSKR